MNDTILTRNDYENLIDKLQQLETEHEELIDNKLNDFQAKQGSEDTESLFDMMKAREHISIQIDAIRKRLANFTLAEEIKDPSKVCVGDWVQVENLETDKVNDMVIVGTTETETPKTRVLFDLPVGVALLGQKRDEVVTAETPKGEIQYRILDFQPMATE